MPNRAEVLEWLRGLSETEFARIMYEANQYNADWGGDTRFVLAEVARSGSKDGTGVHREVSFVAMNRFKEPWSGNEELALRGVCAGCGVTLVSQVREVACPVCGQPAVNGRGHG